LYAEDSYKEPFWAENKGFMTGRDPLGVQNSSIATYSRLLPGMTNVTLRLRYYGFYMWLLQEYDALSKSDSENSLSFFLSFIRRAELAIAYLMVNKYPNEKSIVGSDYASNHIQSADEQGYYDLAKGADKNKDTKKGSVYWDYTSGALGQYFIGSFVNLKLVEVSNRFFVISERGRNLAKAYGEGIPEKSKNALLEVIETGQMNRQQMDQLIEFSINRINFDSLEWRFYKEMILSDDGINNSLGELQYQRQETIKRYLEYLDSPKLREQGLTFDQVQYLLFQEKKVNDASFGWYYYRVNELFHYALETVFWGLLVELDGRIVDIREFMESMTKAVLKYSLEDFLKKENVAVQEIVEEEFSSNLMDDQNLMEDLVKAGNSNQKAIALALKQILGIYKENKYNMDSLLGYEKANYLTDKKGRVSDIVNNYIISNQELPYDKFIYATIKNLINDHISTAYRKMGNGESNLLKFVIEDNFITHIQTMPPKFTSPRLRTLDNFLSDLHLKDGAELTEAGKDLLLELIN